MNTSSKINFSFLWRICLIAALGGLLFGYDYLVIAGAKPFYEAYFGISGEGNEFWQGFTMSSAVFGCLLGAVISGTLSDQFGRKKLLVLAAVLFTVSAIGTAIADSLASFNIYRFIGGGGIGLASGLSPMFIAEVSPKHLRGRFVSFNQLTLVIGILMSQIVNYMIARPVPAGFQVAEIAASWNGQFGWRWMFGAETVPAALFLLFIFFIPESPRWLVKKGKTILAESILKRIGGADYAHEELLDIEKTCKKKLGMCNSTIFSGGRCFRSLHSVFSSLSFSSGAEST